MLMPKKVKYRKQQRGRMAGKAWRGSDVSFGDYGLKALEPCWMTARQIEAARVAMTRAVKRGGKIWIRLFPDTPITKKPQETRMGKGKGAVVAVQRQIRDALYGKTQKRTSKFLAHNEANDAKVGDKVAIVEARPMSRRKRWVVTRVVEKAKEI